MDPGSSCFHSDPDFCPECGSILPLPGLQDTITCPRCKFAIDVKALTILADIPPLWGSLCDLQIDRKCSRCGHEGMTYHTRQMRSADEGQTVFYTCVKCKYQEKEDS
ncbi:DNA-directed RNA polymerase I subunit RPA12 isoform X3 [Rhinatrema bivittatum]|uniref:DNA-directed RNA polymerase I subunit RPA12 isoform X3 n=1 Tax=Rhinatrema bivittatum TaxID=194408 RepID=UPI00112D444F|nr:DNA-directed RNA polymerase I subunit RPA12 isoform X3 [Rhinatrema bivittatum]